LWRLRNTVLVTDGFIASKSHEKGLKGGGGCSESYGRVKPQSRSCGAFVTIQGVEWGVGWKGQTTEEGKGIKGGGGDTGGVYVTPQHNRGSNLTT